MTNPIYQISVTLELYMCEYSRKSRIAGENLTGQEKLCFKSRSNARSLKTSRKVAYFAWFGELCCGGQILLVEENTMPRANHQPGGSHRQTLPHKDVRSKPPQGQVTQICSCLL
jgi:hypothetical protein